MDEKRAREILGDGIIKNDVLNIATTKQYVRQTAVGVDMDGLFTIEQLEAIAWWARNKFIVVRRG